MANFPAFQEVFVCIRPLGLAVTYTFDANGSLLFDETGGAELGVTPRIKTSQNADVGGANG